MHTHVDKDIQVSRHHKRKIILAIRTAEFTKYRLIVKAMRKGLTFNLEVWASDERGKELISQLFAGENLAICDQILDAPPAMISLLWTTRTAPDKSKPVKILGYSDKAPSRDLNLDVVEITE